ncbi:MAG: acyl-CoA dehydrogenase family protein [Solirubrobacteraceae bacterium]|nr:acyl-CoA dehydrogenase family protein [Solirubrobacteraceae bacterium]
MDLTFTPTELAFRDELRTWLRDHDPGPAPDGEDADFAWRRRFQEELAAGGWAGVHWPEDVGGRGATLTESAIFFEELARAGAPLPANVLGLVLAGPTIMSWGTDAQRERLLPAILDASEIWCQGFSEPSSGSDLASLRTRAVRDGDGWRITGQKVWTSFAQHARWCMLLARTDQDAPKHRGITYFLLDMEQDGVDVVPLRQITGESEFNELFLGGAWVPDDMVLGPVGAGWRVALTTLMNERAGLGFFLQARLRQDVDELAARIAQRGLLDDPAVAERLGELHRRTEVIRLTAYRGLSRTERDGEPGPEGSLTKWLWSETNQELTQFAVDVLGPTALDASDPWAHRLLRARGNTIEGGTTEVLRDIVSGRVLGLPKAR